MDVRFGTAQARWVIAATVIGSGVVFLDGTVVNIAIPAIRSDLAMSTSGLQWTIDAYLVTLTSLLLLGGRLGDIAGRRRVFVAGLIGFAITSVACGLAPSGVTLIAGRACQGIAAAFLVPGSLALISSTFHPDDRARAIGAWSGLAGVTSAIGPFVGGWLIASSWRLIFFINVPLVAVTIWIALRHVPESKEENAGAPDWSGAVAITVALAGITFALIEGPHGGAAPIVTGVLGVIALAAFIVVERHAKDPMLPLSLFRSTQFTGANLTTLAVYAALGGAFFLVVVQLELRLGYSALGAGMSLLPFTVFMLAFSARAGALAQRIGPRLPMTIGPLVAAVGVALFTRIGPGASYVSTVLPSVAVFGIGMTLTVAPLTSAVLAAVDEHRVGVASGVNNAVARLGGAIAVAVLPALARIDFSHPRTLAHGFPTAMWISAALCASGGILAFATIRKAAKVRPVPQASVVQPCHDPCLSEAV